MAFENSDTRVDTMRVLTADELDAVAGGFAGALPSGVAAGAGQVANGIGVCDYHHQSERVYCFNDVLGPDFSYWVE